MEIASEKLSEDKENVQYSEMRMTVATIKQSTKEFDPEVIRRIVMRHMKIPRIESLQTCIDLVILDLSFNQIIKIEGLKGCVKLKRLILTGNLITSLEGISKETNPTVLEELLLEGNQISELTKNSKTELSQLINLRRLAFKKNMGSLQNPICDKEDYRKSIFECLPNLTYLDSTHSEHYDPDLNINSEEIEQIAPEVLKNLWKKDQRWDDALPKYKFDYLKYDSEVREYKKLIAEADGLMYHYQHYLTPQ